MRLTCGAAQASAPAAPTISSRPTAASWRSLPHTADGVRRLWLRPLNVLDAVPRSRRHGGARTPFWSPDGRSLGFFADGQLKTRGRGRRRRRRVRSAPPRSGAARGMRTAPSCSAAGASYTDVSANGGTASCVSTAQPAGVEARRSPTRCFCPTADTFSTSTRATARWAKPAIYAGPLDAGPLASSDGPHVSIVQQFWRRLQSAATCPPCAAPRWSPSRSTWRG